MSREELKRASDRLETAASKADANADRLEDIAGQLEDLAEADHGPDHGRLARFENALLEINDEEPDPVVEEVTDAHEALKEYRSGVEGV